MDLTNVQGNIVPGFNKANQALLLLGFSGRGGGQSWLRSVRGAITSAADVFAFRETRRNAAAESTPELVPWTNVAFTWQGLQVLLGPGGVAGMPSVFSNGQVPFCETQPGVHALLHVGADDASILDAELQRHRAGFARSGISELRLFTGQTLGGGAEHFGFRDGVSTVVIDGIPTPTGADIGETPLAPGEFFFGQPDAFKRRALPGPEWTRDGTFVAFMQLEQDVPAFREATLRAAQRLGITPEHVAERIVGRSIDGRLVGGGDPLRLSHIGRARPGWISGAARSRIIRRGIPYGPRLSEAGTEGGERGLLFVSYQADLARQFEQVWRIWLNGRAFPGPGANSDGLVGQPTGSTVAAAARPVVIQRAALKGGVDQVTMPRFVKPRYGGYFLAPSLAALPRLAGG